MSSSLDSIVDVLISSSFDFSQQSLVSRVDNVKGLSFLALYKLSVDVKVGVKL
jgi:hypothetical protein